MSIIKTRFVTLLLLIFFALIAHANPAQIRYSREEKPSNPPNDLDVEALLVILESLPMIGERIKLFADSIAEDFDKLDRRTHGFFSRFLNGLTPCNLSLHGIKCDRMAVKQDVYGAVKEAIDETPSRILPDFFKAYLDKVAAQLVDSAVDSILGDR